MGGRANRVEALREQAEGVILERHVVLDVMRVELDEARNNTEGVSLTKDLAKATTEAGDLRLQKFSAEASLRRLFDQVAHAQEELSRLLSELSAVRAEWDETIDNVAAAREEAFRFSAELVALRSEVEALHARGANLDISRETSHVGLEAERVVVLGSREAKLLVECEVARAKVARLRTELETSQADLECFKVASSHGGDTLSLGSIFASARAAVIAEYLRSDVQRRREEFEHSHHSRSGYVKALLDVAILFLGIDFSSLYQTP
ncbi:hypothetical protein ACLOJK_007061 [Asimina triloba]